MRKIYIDYDTTLVNLIDPWVSWINHKYHVNITSNDINRWYFLGEVFGREADDFWRIENHYREKDVLLPFEGAVDFFHQLQEEYGKENIKIISSTRDHHMPEKLAHMAHYFGIDTYRVAHAKNGTSALQSDTEVILTSKEKHLFTKDGILIDDYPLHVLEHIHFNDAPGIVFNLNNSFGWCKESNFSLDNGIPEQYKKEFKTVADFYAIVNKGLYVQSRTFADLSTSIKEFYNA